MEDLSGYSVAFRPSAESTKQKTLGSSIQCSGVGLHSGAKISMSLHPSDVDSGIVFRRSDVRSRNRDIRALYSNVHDTRLCTTLANEAGVSVGTVEHLMAALAGCEIDNCVVELDGPEVPIMDGSAEPFVFLIECAGIVIQKAPRRVIKVEKPVSTRNRGTRARFEPASDFSIQLAIQFDNPLIGSQDLNIRLQTDVFKAEISRARTFGFLEDVEALRQAGLVLGGSLDNAVVLNGDRILNASGLRYQDEFVRHKVLDCIGDLYLAGAPLLGRFVSFRAGHQVNNRLLRTLFATKSAWRYTTLDEIAGETEGDWTAVRASAAA